MREMMRSSCRRSCTPISPSRYAFPIPPTPLCVPQHAKLEQDIQTVEVSGLEDSPFVDKMDGASTKTQSGPITFTAETDRVYTPTGPPSTPITVQQGGSQRFKV